MNPSVFTSPMPRPRVEPVLPAPTAVLNNAGGPAYSFRDEHALAQIAVTGCFNGTFYTNPEQQLSSVKTLAGKVSPEFLAKLCVYSRESGYMKDMPAFLLATLSARSPELFAKVFDRVVDSGKMVRNFVQVLRSGETGHRSLGYLPRKLIREWFAAQTDEELFKQSVGNTPSLADVIRLAHVRPGNEQRAELHRYLLGYECKEQKLPPLVRQYEQFKRGDIDTIPDVPFQMLDGLPAKGDFWPQVARNASWHTTRMNLNTFMRHGVFNDPELVQIVAERLADSAAIKRAKVFPYQLMAAFKAATDVPYPIREALQTALEHSTKNVPRISGSVVVCPDVSGSMKSSVTGNRYGATSAIRCVDVAALVSATLMRVNPGMEVIPFECDAVKLQLNPRDSVMTNADLLAGIGGGGTNCAAPLQKLVREGKAPDVVVFVSDNESWHAANELGAQTPFLSAWHELRSRNPSAKLICIDVTPNTTSQAGDSESVLNIGGFSDHVFEVISDFVSNKHAKSHWLTTIEEVQL